MENQQLPEPPRLDAVAASVPFFLLMLRNAKAWGGSDTPPEERLSNALQLAFTVHKPEISLFFVTNAIDYRRIVVGFCCNRENDPAGDKFRFLAITPAELDAVGVSPRHAPEDKTACLVASRRLHYNAGGLENQWRNLCVTLFAAARSAEVLTKAQLRAWVGESRSIGCGLTKRTTGPCQDADCLALA